MADSYVIYIQSVVEKNYVFQIQSYLHRVFFNMLTRTCCVVQDCHTQNLHVFKLLFLRLQSDFYNVWKFVRINTNI